ncbi:MAG: ribonuclease I [Thiobacillaceae bacterium]
MKKTFLLALLLISAGTSAGGLLFRVAPPTFNYYTLSLSLAPAFCEEGPGRVRHSRQCNQLTDAEFRSQPLTLHGLWPSRLDRHHPVWCGKDQHEGGRFCRMDVVPLSSLTRRHLADVMPGISDCLDRYEWAKHGTCSGMGADAYFSRAVELVDRANHALGRQILSSAGNEIPLVQIRARLSQADPQLTEATIFDCRSPRGGGRPMLSEIRIYFEKDPVTGGPGKPLPFRSAGVKNYNSGCPAGRAYIDRP